MKGNEIIAEILQKEYRQGRRIESTGEDGTNAT